MKTKFIRGRKLNMDEIVKKNQFKNISQIKQITIKRLRTKFES